MNSDDQDIDFIRKQLRSLPAPCPDLELRTDLWPRMLERLGEAPPRFGWFEVLLASLILVALAVFPQLIPVMLFNL